MYFVTITFTWSEQTLKKEMCCTEVALHLMGTIYALVWDTTSKLRNYNVGEGRHVATTAKLKGPLCHKLPL